MEASSFASRFTVYLPPKYEGSTLCKKNLY
jgi:hypothetical protein